MAELINDCEFKIKIIEQDYHDSTVFVIEENKYKQEVNYDNN